MIATLSPSIRAFAFADSQARPAKPEWDASCEPSPALTIGALPIRARCCGAPAIECRTTMQSGAIASRLRAVSSSVSPLLTLEVETLMLTASAESRLAAISKEVRVRVDDLEEEVDDCAASQSRHLFDLATGDVAERFSRVEQVSDFARLQVRGCPGRCLRLNCTVLMKIALWFWYALDLGL